MKGEREVISEFTLSNGHIFDDILWS